MARNTIARLVLLGGLIALQSILLACATGPVHFRRSYDVSDTFENAQLLSRHQYYYNGVPYSINAVVAIQKEYTLTSPHWHAVEMERASLRHMVDRMLNHPGSEYNTDPNGAYIFNDHGQVIGAWYSVWALPMLTFISDTEFTISQPMTVFPLSNRDPEEWVLKPLLRGF
jgi:hypothetical protein